MLKNLFVPYEIALILKNLGFNQPCFTNYFRDGLLSNETVTTLDNENIDNFTDKIIAAPIHQQALDYLRIFHKIEITVLESYETPGLFEATLYSELIPEDQDEEFGEGPHTDYYCCLNEAIIEACAIIKKSKDAVQN